MFAQSAQDSKPDQAITQIDFVAIEDTEEDDEIDSRPAPRFVLKLAAGAGFPKVDRLNDYISWINLTSAGDVDDIEYHDNYLCSFEYFFRPEFGIGAGYEFFSAGADGSVFFLAEPRRFEIDLKTYGVFGLVHGTWQMPKAPFAVDIAARAGYYRSSYDEAESGYLASGDDRAWGAEMTGGLSWRTSPRFALGVEVGYRWLKFDDYGVAWVSPGNPPASADFGGATTRLFFNIGF